MVLAASAAGAASLLSAPRSDAQDVVAPAQAPQATPVSVAIVEQRDVAIWDEFSGRLEAVERVEVRSRVAGAVHAIHFREGALVKQGDPLVTIDPAPFAAEVERAEAQVGAARARVQFTRNELERGQQLFESRNMSQRDLDQRMNAHREAEANLRAAQAQLQSARLNLGYTEVRAPVAGRVGKREITVGNLVAAGPDAPVLTTLVSVNPIYASFNADEQVVARALKTLGPTAHLQVDRIPVQMVTATTNGTTFEGRLQLIDNQVDARSGTVRVRAVFDNADGALMPGQFARLRMGQPKTEPALLVSERAVGTDQNKKFVMVVSAENKAEYREVTLGASVDGLRVVTSGLNAGERIVVNGLHRIRPGALVAPQLVQMDGKPAAQHAQNSASK
ncbi:MAG TPA: efflux RND transporter periplasmic adaptor subunit [Alphaproteobacteria bacterium]|nr:efflux RND transporter periplasmic adaptor subunit [Alphaproteobacteria bacterium]